MRILLTLILTFMLGAPQQATFFGQNVPAASGVTWSLLHTAFTAGCSLTTSCTITVPSTTSGTTLEIAIITGNTTTISTVSGGGGTWTLCAASACHNSNSGNNMDGAYDPAGTGATTSITVTLNTAATGFFAISYAEIARSTGSATIDTTGNAASTGCTSCTGATLTLSGTDDFVGQFIGYNGSCPCSVNSPYLLDSLEVIGYRLNIASGTAPVFTQTGSGSATMVAMAFK